MEGQKKKFINGLKILVIVILVIAIGFLAFMHWKSDVILRKVEALVEARMEDSLRYDQISLEWFRYFPSAALEIEGLRLGSDQSPFIRNADIDVVMKLLPLFSERIVIKRLNITGGDIYITKHGSRWSYDLFKSAPRDTIQKANMTSDTSGWEMVVRHIHLDGVNLHYDDADGMAFMMEVLKGNIDGQLSEDKIDADVDLDGSMQSFHLESYSLAEVFEFDLESKYQYEKSESLQQIKDCHIRNKGLILECEGFVRDETDKKWIDLAVKWNDGDPQVIKTLLPSRNIKSWNDYKFSGNSEGQVNVKGYSSKEETPHIAFSSELKDGAIKFPGQGGQLKGMLLDVAYDNGEKKEDTKSYLRANLRKSSFQGHSFKGNMRMENLDAPVVNADLEGALPAGLLNFFSDSSVWNFKEGLLDVEHYSLQNLVLKTFSTKNFIAHSKAKVKGEDLKLTYGDDVIEINNGFIDLDDAGKMEVNLDELLWNKARGEKVKGELIFAGDQVDFNLHGKHSSGEVTTKGAVTGLGAAPVMNATWNVKDIEIQELLASFSNFDQTFITDKNLKGEADVWTETTIPYDANGNIIMKKIVVRAAIEINDGQLKDMKILEDFSNYIHLDDLKDIRFNTFRNYLKIEDGKVYLPVVFLQSSAVNMSINGVHSFDQEILYNMKINAGQVMANKLKKSDSEKKYKAARKSGWINLYFVLSGTTSDVKYEQDQKQVISSFEQSAKMKESLRNYLVDLFGHDVYWLEPNEWEDIPEYR